MYDKEFLVTATVQFRIRGYDEKRAREIAEMILSVTKLTTIGEQKFTVDKVESVEPSA